MANTKREALRSLSEAADAAYRGLVDYLETLQRKKGLTGTPFRMPVRSFDKGRRELAGTIATGNVKLGDEIVVLPSARLTKIKRITGSEGDLQSAQAGAEVVITLADQLEVASGDMLAAPQKRPSVADQFEAHLVCLSPEPLLPGRTYLMNINDGNVVATVTALKHHIDVATQAKLAAKTLNLGEIGVCNLSIARPVAFDAYADNHDTGAFILRNRGSNAAIAAGMIDFARRRATNIHHQIQTVGKAARTSLMRPRPSVLWFTGLPAAGKSTIANLVDAALNARGIHSVMLDGANLRPGLTRALGFTEADRVENIRRVGEGAKLMADGGLIVLCSFISPFRAERRMVRELIGDNEFIEVFVH